MAVDWLAIRTEYITTSIGYRALCKKYGISMSVLKEYGRREQWVTQREQYRHKTVTKAVSKACTKESNRLASLIVSADKMAAQIQRALEDEEQLYRYQMQRREKYDEPITYTDTDKDGCTREILISEKQWVEDTLSKKFDTKAARDLTAALKDLTATVRNLYDLPTQAEAEAQRIAAERLRLDKAKADEGGADKQIEVVFMDESMDEYSK